MGMATDAMDHLHHIRSYLRDLVSRTREGHELSIIKQFGGTIAGVSGTLTPFHVPQGWEWRIERWSFSAPSAGPVSCILYAAEVPDASQILEAQQSAFIDAHGRATYADAVSNNGLVREGSPILPEFNGITAGSECYVRLQVRACRLGSPHEADRRRIELGGDTSMFGTGFTADDLPLHNPEYAE